MIDIALSEMRDWFGFGVAGNFAGHLEQAGEAADFVNVTSEGAAPKGIFPWYAPGSDTFLGEFPLSNDEVVLPAESPEFSGPLNLQIEPEVGLACRVVWQGDTVVTLEPFALGAFNDCSIRRPGAPEDQSQEELGAGVQGGGRTVLRHRRPDPGRSDGHAAPGLPSAAATVRNTPTASTAH